MKKYQLIDIEDELSNEWAEVVTEKGALGQIHDWNMEMGTDYGSISEFNEKEQYWQFKEVTDENNNYTAALAISRGL